MECDEHNNVYNLGAILSSLHFWSPCDTVTGMAVSGEIYNPNNELIRSYSQRFTWPPYEDWKQPWPLEVGFDQIIFDILGTWTTTYTIYHNGDWSKPCRTETANLIVSPPLPVCEDYISKSECLAAGCYWYNNACHSTPLILRPNANGTYSQLFYNAFSTGWECVVDDDGWNSVVYSDSGTKMDTYNIENFDSTGIIDRVTLFFVARVNSAAYPSTCRGIIRTGGTNYYTSTITPPADWTLYSKEYTVNPSTGVAWTIANLNNLQIGFESVLGAHPTQFTACTQMYVVVDYSEEPEICSWIESKGGPSGLIVADVFEVVDSYLYQTPPTGYSFIPILVEVFGIIDYFLGFNGDTVTGCDFF